jgi:hypothetical protein
MHHAPPVSIFSPRWMTRRSACVILPLLCLVAAPARSPAQDAGVSGIPPGPGNVNGLNGSVRDPSGIGNAARMPPLPQQHSAITPVPPPLASGSNITGYGVLPPRRVVRTRPTRFGKRGYKYRYDRAVERAAVKENDRLLDRKLTTICRGC